MKRIIFVFILAITTTVMGQRDLYQFERVPDYYYGDFWIDQINPYQPTYSSTGRVGYSYTECNWFGTTVAHKMITNNELKVVGLAIAEWQRRNSDVDSFRVDQYRIYKHHYDEMELLESGDWNYYKLDPTYIYHPLQFTYHGNEIDTVRNFSWSFPLYEVYFHKPVYVNDSFYVSRTGFNSGTGRHNEISYSTPVTQYVKINEARYQNPVPQIMYRSELPGYEHTPSDLSSNIPTDTNWRMLIDTLGGFTVMFPIIDTTYFNPNVEIDEEELNQEVTLSPNPTHGMAMLNSNVMIKTFDVYASDGRLVEHKLVNGLVFPLYTDHWAKGLYLVHVHTLHGTIVKKLMVQ